LLRFKPKTALSSWMAGPSQTKSGHDESVAIMHHLNESEHLPSAAVASCIMPRKYGKISGAVFTENSNARRPAPSRESGIALYPAFKAANSSATTLSDIAARVSAFATLAARHRKREGTRC
jgi:hypothetical protein